MKLLQILTLLFLYLAFAAVWQHMAEIKNNQQVILRAINSKECPNLELSIHKSDDGEFEVINDAK